MFQAPRPSPSLAIWSPSCEHSRDMIHTSSGRSSLVRIESVCRARFLWTTWINEQNKLVKMREMERWMKYVFQETSTLTGWRACLWWQWMMLTWLMWGVFFTFCILKFFAHNQKHSGSIRWQRRQLCRPSEFRARHWAISRWSTFLESEVFRLHAFLVLAVSLIVRK